MTVAGRGSTQWRHSLTGMLLLWAGSVSVLLLPPPTQAEPLPQVLRLAPDSTQGQAYLQEAWRYFLAQPGVQTEPAQGPVRLMVVFDPDCIHCHDLWLALRRYSHSGVSIRWVPVAVVRASTLNKAAAIVSAPDPAQALRQDEMNFDSVRHEGGILPLYQVPARLAEAIRGSTRRWRTLVGLLPVMLYRAPAGKGIGIMAGVPPRARLDALITELGGNPTPAPVAQ